MKLKEFVIWAYKLPLEDAGRISNFSRSVLAHFERSFNPIVTDGVYRAGREHECSLFVRPNSSGNNRI